MRPFGVSIRKSLSIRFAQTTLPPLRGLYWLNPPLLIARLRLRNLTEPNARLPPPARRLRSKLKNDLDAVYLWHMEVGEEEIRPAAATRPTYPQESGRWSRAAPSGSR